MKSIVKLLPYQMGFIISNNALFIIDIPFKCFPLLTELASNTQEIKALRVRYAVHFTFISTSILHLIWLKFTGIYRNLSWIFWLKCMESNLPIRIFVFYASNRNRYTIIFRSINEMQIMAAISDSNHKIILMQLFFSASELLLLLTERQGHAHNFRHK